MYDEWITDKIYVKKGEFNKLKLSFTNKNGIPLPTYRKPLSIEIDSGVPDDIDFMDYSLYMSEEEDDKEIISYDFQFAPPNNSIIMMSFDKGSNYATIVPTNFTLTVEM